MVTPTSKFASKIFKIMFNNKPKKAKDLIIIGDQSTVIDKLIEFIDIVGPFGTLLITGHDFGNSRKLWESSFTKMSESVEPILSKYLKQKFAA